MNKKNIKKLKPIKFTSTDFENLMKNLPDPKLNESEQLEELEGGFSIVGIPLRFSLSRQKEESKYLYRGTISIIDPGTGRIMESRGVDRRKHEKTLEKIRAKRMTTKNKAAEPSLEQQEKRALADNETKQEQPSNPVENENKTSGDPNRAHKLRRQIYFVPEISARNAPFSDIREEIVSYLLEQGQKLFNEYRSTILNCIRESITPKTITPLFAMMIYFDSFASETGRNTEPVKLEHSKRELERLFLELPEQSMPTFRQLHFRHHPKFQALSSVRKKMLYDFWKYCTDRGYCAVMSNPIPLPEKRAASEAARLRAASTPRMLSSEQIAELYRICMEKHDGLACGICLLLNGYSEKFVRSLRWKDIVFRDQLVLILNYEGDRASATKDFTRPCNAVLAEILRLRYQELLQNESMTEKKLQELPVVANSSARKSKQNVPRKSEQTPLTNKQFVEKCTAILGSCGVAPEVFRNLKGERNAAAKQLLRNTYVYLVNSCMGIEDDEGTRQFLLGMKLESITDDNYVSYTSPEASERLFAIQNRCLPARPLPGERTVTDLGNGMVRIELQPRATNETLSVLLQGDFAPGLNLEATARHGVSASVRVRELKEDGTPKRAKKKTKTS